MAATTHSVSLHRLGTGGGAAISEIRVAVQRVLPLQLQLSYRVTGDLMQLCVPLPLVAERRDELWRHTCAELFVALPDQAAYVEFNLAPSTCWAAYEFSDYRLGMHAAAVDAPVITVRQDGQVLELQARVSLPLRFATAATLQASLTMVIEGSDGQHSYWAAQHATLKPDFHRRDSFVVII